MKEVLRQTMEIEKTADALLLTTPGAPGAPARIKELEACAEKGSSICIQLPCLPLVLNRLQQVNVIYLLLAIYLKQISLIICRISGEILGRRQNSLRRI